MSRLGRTPIAVPGGVKVSCDQGGTVTVQGPKGTLTWTLPAGIGLKMDEGQPLRVTADTAKRRLRPMHGLSRALINNMVIGVSQGFERRLAVVGVGYIAQLKGKVLELTVGRANVEKLEVPEGLEVEIGGRGLAIMVRGCDKQKVGEFAARVRKVHPPEPYKGKGIRYEGEVVKRKQGKTLVGGGGK